MQRRSFFKTLAAVAGYIGASKVAGAVALPSTAPDLLEVMPISAPPIAEHGELPQEGPFIVTLNGLGFIIPSHFVSVRYNSEFTVHMATGVVLKNRVAMSGNRLLEIGESLEIPILDHLIDTSAMWPELDPDDELNDVLAGRARKANIWTPRVRRALIQGGDAANRIRSFHAASIGKATHYSDWPV